MVLFVSLILFVSACQIVDTHCHSTDENEMPSTFRFFSNINRLCRLTRLGIIAGLVGCLTSGTAFTKKIRSLNDVTRGAMHIGSIEIKFAFGIVFVSGFAAAMITSSWGPGKVFGNMYTSTWLLFLFSTKIAVECFIERWNHASLSIINDNSLLEGTQSPRMKWGYLCTFCMTGTYAAIDSVSNQFS